MRSEEPKQDRQEEPGMDALSRQVTHLSQKVAGMLRHFLKTD